MVAYSFVMFARPPMTLWQDAACSRAEPSPGLTAYTIEPISVAGMSMFSWPGMVLMVSKMPISSGSFARTSSPATRAFSRTSTALERPTYSGSRRESVNSARPSGFERKDEVSPDGMSSSVVVTGSMIFEQTFRRMLSASGDISGQSLMFGP